MEAAAVNFQLTRVLKTGKIFAGDSAATLEDRLKCRLIYIVRFSGVKSINNCRKCVGFANISTTNGKCGFCYRGEKYARKMAAAGRAPVRFRWALACAEFKAKKQKEGANEPTKKTFMEVLKRVRTLRRLGND